MCWCRNAGSRASKRCAGAAFCAQDVQLDLLVHFGGLLEKHLFLGRTLLLRLQGYQTCAAAGMLVPGPANAVLVQHLVVGVFSAPFHTFRWPTKEAFVLRTDAAFAAMG